MDESWLLPTTSHNAMRSFLMRELFLVSQVAQFDFELGAVFRVRINQSAHQNHRSAILSSGFVLRGIAERHRRIPAR